MRFLITVIATSLILLSTGYSTSNAAEFDKLNPKELFNIKREYRFDRNGNTAIITYRPDGTRSVSDEFTSYSRSGTWRAKSDDVICGMWQNGKEGCSFIADRGDGKIQFVNVESGRKFAILKPK
jgi:hypothetical protein